MRFFDWDLGEFLGETTGRFVALGLGSRGVEVLGSCGVDVSGYLSRLVLRSDLRLPRLRLRSERLPLRSELMLSLLDLRCMA